MKSNPVELVANYLREHSGTTIANVAVGKAIGEIRHHASDDTYSYVCTVEGTVQHVSYDEEPRRGTRPRPLHGGVLAFRGGAVPPGSRHHAGDNGVTPAPTMDGGIM